MNHSNQIGIPCSRDFYVYHIYHNISHSITRLVIREQNSAMLGYACKTAKNRMNEKHKEL